MWGIEMNSFPRGEEGGKKNLVPICNDLPLALSCGG